MNKVRFPLWLAVVIVLGFTMLGGVRVAFAQEDRDENLSRRLDRIERRLDQMTERQERFTDRARAAVGERPLPPAPGLDQPARRPGPTLEKGIHCLIGMARACFLVMAICHVLLTVWVFQDIRKRGEGSGFFVVLTLLAGFCGAILYALVRIGDKKA